MKPEWFDWNDATFATAVLLSAHVYVEIVSKSTCLREVLEEMGLCDYNTL